MTAVLSLLNVLLRAVHLAMGDLRDEGKVRMAMLIARVSATVEEVEEEKVIFTVIVTVLILTWRVLSGLRVWRDRK